MNGWKPRVDIKAPFPIFTEDRLSQMLLRRGDWIYKGFTPTNSYELHDAYASATPDSYECQDTNLRMYRELTGRGIIQQSTSIFPKSKESPYGPKITFDSFFESGNLAFVFRPNTTQLILFLNIDTNTRGHTQWFYFTAVCEGYTKVNIEILNMSKPTSIFSRGGRPVWSTDNRNWQPVMQATYSETKGVDRTLWLPPEYRTVNSLKFPFEFEPKKKVYFAYGVPFTYSQLLTKLKVLQSKDNRPHQSVLCMSESGIPVPVLAFRCTGDDPRPPGILIVARTHPGETCGSHMATGLLQWIMSDYEACRQLRQSFDIHVVPMVNVDGVIAGNFRTGLAGDDLNRRFSKPAELLHPIVIALKNYVKNVNRTRGNIVYCLDLHGHSTKPDVFTYGPEMGDNDKLYRLARYYTKLLGDRLKCFKPNRCSWQIPKSKSSTARSVMIRTFGIKLTYTVEASTSARTTGSEDPPNQGSGGLQPFTVADYAEIGQNLISTLAIVSPYLLAADKQVGLLPLPEPDVTPEAEDIEEGGSDSESGDEDYSQKEKKRFLMRYEASMKSNFDQNQSRAGKEYFARRTRKKAEPKSREFTIQRMGSLSKSRAGLPTPSVTHKSAVAKDPAIGIAPAQMKLRSTLNSKPMMLNLNKASLRERESFKSQINPTSLSTELENVKQMLQSKAVNSITRNHTMKDLSLQATPTKTNLNLGHSSYDRSQALTDLARSFDQKRNANSHILADSEKAKERADLRRRKIQGLQTQMGGILYGIEPHLSHQSQRHEPPELHDVLFSQVSIKFPRRGDAQPEEEEGFKPTISRKVLMGSDFSKLIQQTRRVRGPSLPPVPAATATRHRFLLRTKDG